MQMSQPDIQGLTEFGRNGRRLVEQCDRSGKIVVNSNSGDDNSNEFGKVALLNPPEQMAILDALVKKADGEWPAERRFATVVFDGREQPNFSENPQVVDLIRLPKRPTGERWREIAVASVHQQGFGVTDWYEGEYPMALWVGQELNVHGQARVILRRRAMENVIFVGESLNAMYGMLAALLCSVAINVPVAGVRLAIVDRALPGTPWERTLELVTEQLLKPLGYSATRTREPAQLTTWIGEWLVELDRRAGLDEGTLQIQPAWILVLAGADRLPLLSRVTNNYGSSVESPDGEKLRALYTRGSALGLHVVVSFPAAASMKQCLDRTQLENFKHRVVTQIAESDSFLLLGNDHAAKLQRGEARPLFAICYDQIGGHATKFKPYTSNAHMTWLEQLGDLKTNLNRWREKSHVDG